MAINTWQKFRHTRKRHIPTIESKAHGEKLCDIYRWYTTKASTYLNNRDEYDAEITYLGIRINRIKITITNKYTNATLNRAEQTLVENSEHSSKQMKHKAYEIHNKTKNTPP